jgi:hypothetical protein
MVVARPRNHHYLHEVVVIWRPCVIHQQSTDSDWLACGLGFGCSEHCRQIAL